jgi:hypothetical protein
VPSRSYLTSGLKAACSAPLSARYELARSVRIRKELGTRVLAKQAG